MFIIPIEDLKTLLIMNINILGTVNRDRGLVALSINAKALTP